MPAPERIIIAALAQSNRVIGQGGKLPWRLPADLARFKQLTLGHPVIFGRKTWQHDLGQRPLPQRHTIVVSSTLPLVDCLADRSPDDASTGDRPSYPFQLSVVRSLDQALALADGAPKLFIAGGASIYSQALAIADTLELTLVDGHYDGDTFFPDYRSLVEHHFDCIAQECHPGYRFETYRRRAIAAP
ncbi:MAG TPA: dihydrofolate reductase [Chroococcidiopsis sp.]